MITAEREDEMYEYWLAENGDDETEEWRRELTTEEEQLVAVWDARYCSGVEKMMARIGELALQREQQDEDDDSDGTDDYPFDEDMFR